MRFFTVRRKQRTLGQRVLPSKPLWIRLSNYEMMVIESAINRIDKPGMTVEEE